MSDLDYIKANTSLLAYAQQHLEHLPNQAANQFVCVFCGSGTGKSGDGDPNGALTIYEDTQTFYCHSCDNKYLPNGRKGDICDLAAKVNGLDPNDTRAHINAVAKWAGLSLNGNSRKTQPIKNKSYVNQQVPKTRESVVTEQNKQKAIMYRKSCQKALNELTGGAAVEYLQSRGYDLQTAINLGLGYDHNKQSIVIPWVDSEYYYSYRPIAPGAKNLKPKTSDLGTQPIYNGSTLNGDKPVFLVEGEWDGLAIAALGYKAIVLAGLAHADKVIAKAQTVKYNGYIIDLLDVDKPGVEMSKKLVELTSTKGVKLADYAHGAVKEFKDYQKANGYKDVADVYKAAPGVLSEYLEQLIGYTQALEREQQEQERDRAMQRLRILDPVDVLGDIIMQTGCTEPVPTGFRQIDSVLNGGLNPGLYVLGAVSSLGKTTLALQIADQIAASGRDVLFVSIEQSAKELLSKSVSRLMYKQGHGVSSYELSTGSERDRWGGATTNAMISACDEYTKYIAPYMHISEGVPQVITDKNKNTYTQISQPTVADIRTLSKVLTTDDKAPVIFIDYLQLLGADNPRDDVRIAIDKNIMGLRQLARDFKTPVFVISALNRSSYTGVISMDSFKESGAIEYGSDVLLGLQPRNLGKQIENESEKSQKTAAKKIVEHEKSKTVRDIELKVLKNRNGAYIKDPIPFKYHAANNCFE